MSIKSMKNCNKKTLKGNMNKSLAYKPNIKLQLKAWLQVVKH